MSDKSLIAYFNFWLRMFIVWRSICYLKDILIVSKIHDVLYFTCVWKTVVNGIVVKGIQYESVWAKAGIRNQSPATKLAGLWSNYCLGFRDGQFCVKWCLHPYEEVSLKATHQRQTVAIWKIMNIVYRRAYIHIWYFKCMVLTKRDRLLDGSVLLLVNIEYENKYVWCKSRQLCTEWLKER